MWAFVVPAVLLLLGAQAAEAVPVSSPDCVAYCEAVEGPGRSECEEECTACAMNSAALHSADCWSFDFSASGSSSCAPCSPRRSLSAVPPAPANAPTQSQSPGAALPHPIPLFASSAAPLSVVTLSNTTWLGCAELCGLLVSVSSTAGVDCLRYCLGCTACNYVFTLPLANLTSEFAPENACSVSPVANYCIQNYVLSTTGLILGSNGFTVCSEGCASLPLQNCSFFCTPCVLCQYSFNFTGLPAKASDCSNPPGALCLPPKAAPRASPPSPCSLLVLAALALFLLYSLLPGCGSTLDLPSLPSLLIPALF